MQGVPEVIDVSTVAQIATGVVVAIIGMIFGVQKMLKGWKETSTETSVLSMMHTELTRLSSHNSVLAEELAKFQLEVVSLNKQLNSLTIENNRLHNEVVTLTSEVNRLQKMLENSQKGE